MKRTLLGILTPSSNTVLEPATSAMLSELTDTSAHFGRFGVTEISLDAASQAQFELTNQLAAARLLADAKVKSIMWSGTSASWLGFHRDEALCASISETTGIAAGSAVLAINELFSRLNVKRFALVSPYIPTIQQQIIENYAANQYECISEKHLNEHRNFEFSEFSEKRISDLICECAQSRPDAIVIMCTNMRGARVAAMLEQQFDMPIIDSTAAAVWSALRIAGSDPRRVTGWGRLFSEC